jgi:hypothetical protein
VDEGDGGWEVLTSKVDGSTGTDSLSVVSLLQQSVDTTDGELQSWEGMSEEQKAKRVKTYQPWTIGTQTW